ncbi:unnamed protein product, partial [Cuscuta epithymum]
MYFDPLAAKIVFDSKLNITLIPLAAQRQLSSWEEMGRAIAPQETPEAQFTRNLLSRLLHSKLINQHMETFIGEIVGSVLIAGDISTLKPTFDIKKIKVIAEG